MKKKIINGIMMVALVAATSTSFVSCKDTNEDVRIEQAAEIAALQDRLDLLEAQYGDLNRRVTDLRNDLNKTDANVERLTLRCDQLEVWLAETFAKLVTSVEINATWNNMTGMVAIPGVKANMLIANYGVAGKAGKFPVEGKLVDEDEQLEWAAGEKFGYNKDYVSPFTITSTEDGGSLLSNAIAVKSGKVKAEISTLNEKASRGHWNMTPITVNAVYNPTVNCITIPAVNMAEPAFSLKKSKYYNLGYFGYIVAHEMNHAFDSNGFLYDDTGCYKPGWINEEDSEAYKKVMEKITDYYNHYLIMDVYSINGKQTLGENIADLGAVQCILNLSDDKTELEEIFTGIAESWAELIRIQDVTQALEGDVHSSAEARVNAVVSVMDKFYLVYDVKEKDKMYVAPENRVRIW